MIIASISTLMLWKHLNITISIISNLKNLVTYCFLLQEKKLAPATRRGKNNFLAILLSYFKAA